MRTGPQPKEGAFLEAAPTCDFRAPSEVHARQLRTLLERLDVACGVAVTSTNGERSMRPRGREVEKSVGSALPVTPESGNFHRKSGLVRNQKKKVPRYVPLRLLMFLRSMLVMSLMSDRSSASVNLPQL